MKRILLAAAAVMAMMGSTAAMARVDVDISIGVPGVVYGEPDYYYYSPRYVERPRVIILPERVYRPDRVYRSRHFRNEFRGPRYYQPHKHHRHQQRGYHRAHRGGWHK